MAALVTMLAGGLLAFVALIVLLGAVVDGLTNAGLERWVAELIVGGSVTLVGFILVRVGQKALAASSLTPERTANSVRRDIDLLKEHVA